MVLAYKVAMVLARVFFSADGIDDVLAIEDADQAIDARFVGQEFGLVPLNQATGDDHPLALSVVFELHRIANWSISSAISAST